MAPLSVLRLQTLARDIEIHAALGVAVDFSADSIFSINIPYPSVGSFIITCVTAPPLQVIYAYFIIEI